MKGFKVRKGLSANIEYKVLTIKCDFRVTVNSRVQLEVLFLRPEKYLRGCFIDLSPIPKTENNFKGMLLILSLPDRGAIKI